MKHVKTMLVMAVATSILVACLPPSQPTQGMQNVDISAWPVIRSEVPKDAEIESKVDALLAKMTLEQKVAQMIQPEIRDITVEDMRRYGFGSYLNGGGAFPNNDKHASAMDWVNLAEQMYQASMDTSLDGIAIPTMWGTDAVHGHNNVIGATLFPHNIGLGAANDPKLIEKIAKATATEVMVTGIDWIFAPTVATVRDDRWGRTYEGYSEDPEIVRAYAYAIVKGLQGDANKDFLSDQHVLSTVKHFIGDGGTEKGDDQGNNLATEQELVDIHAQGYVGGLTAGAQSVMASFNSWQGNKVHGSRYLLTDVLKTRMGFDGFVVGDWNGHGQIPGCSNDNCPQAVNAGLDMYMVPTDAWKPLMENTIAQVKSGVISTERIDDAVRRILRVKFRAGLFTKPSPANRPYAGKTELLGHAEHRAIAREAVRKSLVLLKNKSGILPLSAKQHILLAGDGAHNIGKQSGGWSITWQGTGNENADFPGATSIYQGIAQQVEAAGGSVELSESGTFDQRPDVAIVVFGEDPYAEGHGDRDNLAYQRADRRDLALLKQLKAQGIPVVSVFISGRPMWVNAELNASDAFVAAWLPGTEGSGIADVLLRDANEQVQYDFTGKLSFSWPRTPEQRVNRHDQDYDPLFAYGFGLSYQQQDSLNDNLPETYQSAEPTNELVLHNGQIQAPWQMSLISDKQSTVITANSAVAGGISYRTIDRQVQEDSFQLTLSNADPAAIAFSSHNGFREDLSAYQEMGASLVFDAKLVAGKLDSAVVAVVCEGDTACTAQAAMTSELNSASDWQTFAIDLQCFARKNVQFDRMITPFMLRLSGSATVALNNIRYDLSKEGSREVQCQ
ncbi:glycoside hydrolase family 3 protein (plasmid) [Pseudoalteromonas sp. T1lg65]|uniref:glycoside hydrolase family 3 protein n=1 Tax=Pseudoalteromonas sp. T1lg65 TaxID=2077101 RepID=UPI003F78C40F